MTETADPSSMTVVAIRDELKTTKSFARACRLAARLYLRTAQITSIECRKAGKSDNSAFWHAAEKDAQEAAEIYRVVMEDARQTAILQLVEAGLLPFAAALDSSDFHGNLGV